MDWPMISALYYFFFSAADYNYLGEIAGVSATLDSTCDGPVIAPQPHAGGSAVHTLRRMARPRPLPRTYSPVTRITVPAVQLRATAFDSRTYGFDGSVAVPLPDLTADHDF